MMVLLSAAMLLFGCGSGSDKKEIQRVTESFFDMFISGDLDGTQQYLDEKYDYLEKSSFPSLDDIEVLKKYNAMFKVSFVSVELNEDTAVVKLSVEHPDAKELIDAQASAIHLGMADDAMEKAFEEKLNDPDLTIVTDDAYISLKKKQNNWEIVTDNNFDILIFLGKTGEITTSVVTENEKKLQEIDEYTKSNIELVDYTVTECEGYFGKVPGIKDISIKNNGDKEIDSLELTIDFVSGNGDVEFTKEIAVLGTFDDTIKPGYSWKMEDDKFFELEGIPEGINIRRVKVSIGDVTFANEVNVGDTMSEEEIYIRDYISLDNYKVSMCTGYAGTVPGLSHLSLKNKGNKDIKELTVTVYFQDSRGRNVAEDSFMVIGGFFGGDTLKANYSWKMEDDKFYEIENLADEVDISRHTVVISDIEFE